MALFHRMLWLGMLGGLLLAIPGHDFSPPSFRIQPLSVGSPAERSALPPHVAEAEALRRAYRVSGEPFSVVVLDTGLNVTHTDFAGRVVAVRNFTADNDGNPADVTDGNGHGTHVTGIIAANGVHRGIAPEVRLIILKVLANDGSSNFSSIDAALKWVLQHREEYHIAAVNISWGAEVNTAENDFPNAVTTTLLHELARQRVAVIAGAGNSFFRFKSAEGMTYPAIVPSTISVGAVYPFDLGQADTYRDGAVAFTTGQDRLTPFSQRLHASTSEAHQTDVFGPGAAYPSSGIASDSASVATAGTSVAAASVTGLVLLLQEYYWKRTGELPPVALLESWLRESATTVFDGDDEDDNVENTGKDFRRMNLSAALALVDRSAPVQQASKAQARRVTSLP